MVEVCAAALLLAFSPGAMPDSLGYTAYDASGQPTTLAAVCDALGDADVVFVGERHDDAVAHALQQELLAAAYIATRTQERPLILGLEMIEADVQPVLDEYLTGLIREKDWLAAGRPWSNYTTDYRPLIETARERDVPVVGTNAPGRYVSLVSRRGGIAVLDTLGVEARAWLPPEIAPPSDALGAKFRDLMGGMAHGSGPSVDGMLAAQNLRDATMAWRIAEARERHPGALVFHVNGSFHSEGGLGIPEHLARLAPETRMLVITVVPDDGTTIDTPGDDFVIRTRGGI